VGFRCPMCCWQFEGWGKFKFNESRDFVIVLVCILIACNCFGDGLVVDVVQYHMVAQYGSQERVGSAQRPAQQASTYG
jgi:hypothetical protein